MNEVAALRIATSIVYAAAYAARPDDIAQQKRRDAEAAVESFLERGK